MIFFCAERLRDFFCVERLLDFFCAKGSHYFLFLPNGCVIFFCREIA